MFTRSILTAAFTLSLAVVVRGQNDTSTLSFAEIIGSNPDLSSLNGAINASGLSLSDAFPDAVTVFAPNNAAFESVATVLSKLVEPQYTAHLQSVLLMHVISGQVLAADLMDGMTVEAQNMDPITVSISTAGNVTFMAPNSNATVVTADIMSSDGVVHIVDTVLLPKFVSETLLDLTASADGYSIVTELLNLTGLGVLVTDELTATVFAPTDEAFMALGDEALAYYRNNSGAATTLLSGHVITPEIVPTQLMKNGPIEYLTPAETQLNVTITGGGDSPFIYTVNGATIAVPNTLAINGIIHGISKVLDVPGAEYPPLNNTVPGPTAPVAGPPVMAPPVMAPTTSSAISTTPVQMTLMAAVMSALFSYVM